MVAAVGIAPVAGRAEIDPAYDQLYRSGLAAAQRDDWETAAKYLRLAAFGFLDEPARLAAGLTNLALVESRIHERDERVRDSLDRVLYLEERFGAYSAAELTSDTRARFADLLGRAISLESLSALPAFRDAARQARLEQMAGLPPQEALAQAIELATIEPGIELWQLEIARRLLEAGRPEAAAARLAEFSSQEPLSESGRCLLGRALAAIDRCADAREPLAACTDTSGDPELAESVIRCEIRTGAWDRAELHLSTLSARASGRKVRRLQKELETARRSGSATRVDATSAGVASPGTDFPKAEEPFPILEDGGEPAEQTSATDLGPIRALVGARTRESLEEARRRLLPVLEREPHRAEAVRLAGEVSYLLRDWEEAIRHFDRVQTLEDSQPVEIRFYLAVALHEAGHAERATQVLRECLPHLRETPFVARYRREILGE